MGEMLKYKKNTLFGVFEPINFVGVVLMLCFESFCVLHENRPVLWVELDNTAFNLFNHFADDFLILNNSSLDSRLSV